MTQDTIQALAAAYAEKELPFKWPTNKKGEPIEQRVGQNAPGSAKHRKEQEKIISAFIEGSKLAIDNNPLVAALKRLVDLKDYKDYAGKDAYYEEKQPLVWKEAREALNNVQVSYFLCENQFIEKYIEICGYGMDMWSKEENETMRKVAEILFDKKKSNVQVGEPAKTDGGDATIEDYKEVIEDHKRLVRELDVLLSGERNAARQASLCDIVAQVEKEGIKSDSVKGTPVLPVEGKIVKFFTVTQLTDLVLNYYNWRNESKNEIIHHGIDEWINTEYVKQHINTNPHTDHIKGNKVLVYHEKIGVEEWDSEVYKRYVQLFESFGEKPGFVLYDEQKILLPHTDKQEGIFVKVSERLPAKGFYTVKGTNNQGKEVVNYEHKEKIWFTGKAWIVREGCKVTEWLDESAGADNGREAKELKILSE